MTPLSISLHKKTYTIHCADSEVENMLKLVDCINNKLSCTEEKHPNMSEMAILAFTLLSLMDENMQQESHIKTMNSHPNTQNLEPSLPSPKEIIYTQTIEALKHIEDNIFNIIQKIDAQT